MSEPTHILQIYPDKKQEMLCRASDGIVLAMRAQQSVIFGDDLNKRRSHIFHSEEKALEFLKGLAQKDIDGNLPLQNMQPGMYQMPAFISKFSGDQRKAVFLEEIMEGEKSKSGLYLPDGSVDIANLSGVRKM